jgi:tRNA-Thr(GGU) m(6)t(6)A37 methyltransferase TsaA
VYEDDRLADRFKTARADVPVDERRAYLVHPIGWVESPLVDPDGAPKQGDEGAPDAWLVLEPTMRPAMRDFNVGTEMVVLTWLDRARRDVLLVHPRDVRDSAVRGVFSTRSADRPNPIGLHQVQILAIDDTRIRVRNLEALDMTPIVDIKPLLGPVEER